MRGLGQPIRHVLEYVCADYIDVRVECEDPGPSAKKNWKSQKPLLQLPFGGNLPFFFDGDTGVRLVQSNAILRYIGRKFNLLGDGSLHQTATLDMVLDQLSDYDGSFTSLAYSHFNEEG